MELLLSLWLNKRSKARTFADHSSFVIDDPLLSKKAHLLLVTYLQLKRLCMRVGKCMYLCVKVLQHLSFLSAFCLGDNSRTGVKNDSPTPTHEWFYQIGYTQNSKLEGYGGKS